MVRRESYIYIGKKENRKKVKEIYYEYDSATKQYIPLADKITNYTIDSDKIIPKKQEIDIYDIHNIEEYIRSFINDVTNAYNIYIGTIYSLFLSNGFITEDQVLMFKSLETDKTIHRGLVQLKENPIIRRFL